MKSNTLEGANAKATSRFRNVHLTAGRAFHRAFATPSILLVLGGEIGLAAVSYIFAVVATASFRDPQWTGAVLRTTIGPLIVCRFGGLASVRLYRRSLRYAGFPDLVSITKAATFSTILFSIFACWRFPSLKIPATTFLVDWAFLQLFWGGLHFSVRAVRMQQMARRKRGKRAVIVGAGDAGMMLLKDLTSDPRSPCSPVALVDDDEAKWGRTICGVAVAGGIADLAQIAADTRADEILICIPSATQVQRRGIFRACRQSNIPFRTLPSLAELAGGNVSRWDLRPPQVEDLLLRDGICIDPVETRGIVGGKTVLITGAGGSIGSELCRQIAKGAPRKLLMLDKSENGLFYVNLKVTELLEAGGSKPLLVDLTDRARVRDILKRERPEIVFHAAAHKHVSLLETHPHEAVRNNVLGTRDLAEAAAELGAECFVNISTDKAVRPCNYMGLSKKLTELCIQELSRKTKTRFMNVRFGNVAGSTASVLPLFWDQIQRGGPIRVTDPRATRYFMSLPEAVHLILQAASFGNGGETFVFDMGEPLNIYELARKMSLFAGLQPGADLAIEFVGLNEGEKISEELWEEWERPVSTTARNVLAIAEQDPLSRGILDKIRTLEELLGNDDCEALLTYLHEIVPGFRRNRGFFPRSTETSHAVAAYTSQSESPAYASLEAS